MASGEPVGADLDEPRADDGRLLIQIDTWEWGLFVGMSPESTPVEYRFQGGLLYARGIDITGRIRAPNTHRNKRVRVWISPWEPDRYRPLAVDWLAEKEAEAAERPLQIMRSAKNAAWAAAIAAFAAVVVALLGIFAVRH